MEKKSNFFERILQIIDYYGIKNVNNFALNWLNYTSSEKINRLKKENTNPSYEIIIDITNKFEDISPEWLLTGNGPMLKKSELITTTLINSEDKDFRPYYDVDFECGFDLIENNQTIQPASYIKFPQYNKAEMWVNVYGKSMEPLITPGDIIAIRELHDWDSYILYGEVYAIVTQEYRTIKIIRKSNKENHLKLVPINTKECDEQEIPKKLIQRVFQVIGTAKRFI